MKKELQRAEKILAQINELAAIRQTQANNNTFFMALFF